MIIAVDDNSGEPEYQQVARQLRERIISGQLPVGEQLPSSRAMLAERGIGRVTWHRAVEALRVQGLVTIRKGQGAWVTARPAVRVLEVRAGDRVSARPPTEAERAELGGGLLSPVLVVTRADGSAEVHSAAVTVCAVTC